MESRLLSPRLVLAAALATTTVVLFTRTVRASRQGQASAVFDVIPQPTTWQPFVAEVIQTTPDAPDLVGWFWRASDGSERYDQAARDGSVHIVTIISVPTGWQYACDLVRDFCKKYPFLQSPVRPLVARRSSTRNLAPTAEVLEGFRLHAYITPQGVKRLEAADLNFADLVVDDPGNGMHRVMFDIKRQEPSPTVFVPPSGIRIFEGHR